MNKEKTRKVLDTFVTASQLKAVSQTNQSLHIAYPRVIPLGIAKQDVLIRKDPQSGSLKARVIFSGFSNLLMSQAAQTFEFSPARLGEKSSFY